MSDIILAALLTCATGDARCTAIETQSATIINICDVEPESAGADSAKFTAQYAGELYLVEISPSCESV